MPPTYRDPSGHLKPWKSGPKQYKTGPRPTGAARLHLQVMRLALASARLERKQDGDELYARALSETLQTFLSQWVSILTRAEP